MPTTIRVHKEYSYVIEGLVDLPDWYDPSIHKYEFDGNDDVVVFNRDQNIMVDEPIWKCEMEFENALDVDHDLDDLRVKELKRK
jgi:hypothetical protein